MKYLLSLFLLIGWAAARGQAVPPSYTGRLDITDSIIMQDKDGELYIVPLDSLHGPIMDKKRWSKISISQTFSTFLVPDYHEPISSTPRLDALEKQVQFLIRRTTELEAEIKQLKRGGGDYGVPDTTYHLKTTLDFILKPFAPPGDILF